MSKTIAIFTASEGHESIAQAIKEKLQSAYNVQVYFEEIALAKFYVALYQFFPSLTDIPLKSLRKNKNTDSLHKLAQIKYQKKIDHFFTQHQPDLLISTYAGYNSSLEKLQKLTQTPFINVLADPKSPYPLSVSDEASSNFIFDEQTLKVCQEYYPQAKYLPVGWFVRDKFEQVYDQTQVRKKLKLKPHMLSFLIASGSEGTNLILKVLPTLIMSERPVQVVVACGHNNTLYKSLKTLNSFLDKNGNHNHFIPLKFTPDIHLYMQAADLVIGKAGPNMLFETVATETPFFAITHIAGQEDGNLEIIEELNLGYVEENLLKAQKLMKSILKNPEQLTQFKPALKKLKKYNQNSKNKLLKVVEKLI